MSKLPSLSGLEIQALKEDSPSKALEALRGLLKDDPRAGAGRLMEKFQKRVARDNKESARLESLWVYEKEAASQGFKNVAGVDEAGRGPLAGPVVAAAVILSSDHSLLGVDDSKKLTAAKREELYNHIRKKALAVGVGEASALEIDELNIYRASQLAMERAVAGLGLKPDFLLTDAMPLPKLSSIGQKPLIHGDALSASIAAASIIAKVTRDRFMGELHRKFPAYGFEGHKGYGTELHMAALKKEGPCPEHRRTFAPVMEVLAESASGGPFGYWSESLRKAGNHRELQQAGMRIKRTALPRLSEPQVEKLRELFRERKSQLEKFRSS